MNLSASVVPRERLPRKILKQGHQLRRMASTSAPPKRDVFEIGPRSKSRNSFDFNRQPQGRGYNGGSGFAWPFNKSENPETTSNDDRSSDSSTHAVASKFRVVGRGGSGSKLRQVSLSNPIVVIEADTPALRQPLDSGAAFYRPSGRGGLGSLSTSTPTRALKSPKPPKPPTNIMGLLRGRKRSENKLNEQYQSHKNSPPRRSRSVYYRSKQNQEHMTESESLDELYGTSSFEEPSTSFSQSKHPDYDTSSHIEEESLRNSSEHRERSLNKLTRTLGAHPLTLMDRQTSKSPIFDNFSTAGEKLIGKKTHHRWDSYESDSDMLESDNLTSPITFAPASTDNKSTRSKRKPVPYTSSEIESRFAATSSTREDDSFQSHSPEPSSSRMPHLHVSTHTDAVDESSDLNGPVAKSDWLVPLNEVVISIRRTGPSKPQSWTGEWDREMKDVIRDLRRL